MRLVSHLLSVYEGRSCSLVRISSESCPWSSLAWQLRMKGKLSELGTNTKTLWTQIVRTIRLDQSSAGGYGWQRGFPVMILGGFYFFCWNLSFVVLLPRDSKRGHRY